MNLLLDPIRMKTDKKNHSQLQNIFYMKKIKITMDIFVFFYRLFCFEGAAPNN